MKRVFGERARQEQRQQQQEQQQQRQQQQRQEGGDLETVVVAVKLAKEIQRSRTPTIQVQVPSSSMLDPIPRSGNRTPTTPKITASKDLVGTSSSSRSSSNGHQQLHLSPTKLEDDDDNDSNDIQSRPLKIPRRERTGDDNKNINHSIEVSSSESTTLQIPPPHLQQSQSAQSQSSSTGRRSSLQLNSQQQNNDHDADPAHSSDDTSAFYLKYQNRALSTEMKSYQLSLRELESERTIRRTHCLTILQSLHQFIHIWNDMEDKITNTKIPKERLQYGVDESISENSNDSKGHTTNTTYSSTGTGDSVEWTRALYNALITLGRCTIHQESENQPRKNGLIDHRGQNHDDKIETVTSTAFEDNVDFPSAEEIVSNLTARARLLQEWIDKLLKQHHDDGDKNHFLQPNDTDTETSTLQQEISNLQARCSLLEGQVAELILCRTDLQQRERRLRRNIYRMSADLITPQQVVASAMSVNKEIDDNGDDVEQSVQIEKQELMKLRQEHELLLESIQNKANNTNPSDHYDVTSHSANILLTKQIKEYQNKFIQLEESITIAEQSIQELTAKLKGKEDEITVLSQRQLSDDDMKKLESIPSLQQQLQNSQQMFTVLETKYNKTEELRSQSLGNEKAALHTISDLVQKFNKRWTELTNSAFTTNTDVTLQQDSGDSVKDPTTIESSNSTHGALSDDKTMALATGETVLSLKMPKKDDTHPQITMSKKIVELQHQLQQALENVRQAESSRENLKMAIALNASLQSKYDEIKAKYTAIQQQSATVRSSSVPVISKKLSNSKEKLSNDKAPNSDAGVASDLMNEMDAMNGEPKDIDINLAVTDSSKNSSRKGKDSISKSDTSKTLNNSESGTDNAAPNHSSSNRPTSSTSSSDKYRKVRKELAVMTANHATLMANNARLLKQIQEKDEMNAKSLSTILHLKSLTEKLVEERDHLEAQMKTASQLALAARLATNAKERVSEELIKEKEESDNRFIVLNEKMDTTLKELQRISIEWANSSSVIATKERELANLVQRSNKLVEENEQQRDTIRKITSTANRCEREAQEAKEKLADLMSKFEKDGSAKNDGGGILGDSSSRSSFTIEQLQTQVSVLKNRLACPVCHYRDKECIIIRCRHMHCKQCVDERVSNRSRKCPTCNVKFAENEVETIFLS